MSDRKLPNIKVRPARLEDLPGIVRVETDTYQRKMSHEAGAEARTLEQRIRLLNGNERHGGWFLVAEYRGVIVGTVILMPTSIHPGHCVSWAASTDNGTLLSTYDPNGKNLYVVSFGVPNGAPPLTAECLVSRVVAEWTRLNGRFLMLCSAIPGFSIWRRKTGGDVDAYWQLRDGRGLPADPMLRYYHEVVGAEPYRLLRNGFPPDEESEGHAVLCMAQDPVNAAHLVSQKIALAGFGCGYKAGKQFIGKPKPEVFLA
jgi:hypothetical protein